MKLNLITRLVIVTLAANAAGCGIEPETIDSLREAINTVSTQVPTAARTGPEDAGIETTFAPPNPDRIDPFSFPADAPVADQAGTTISSVAQVDVLGFANVHEPRVLLRTKGMTKSLRVGEMTHGVEVVSINEPRVELRMGTHVWTASMFDSPTVGNH